MGLPLWKAKTQNIWVWSKERFIGWEGINQEDGRLSGTSNSSLKSTEFRLLLCEGKGKWEGLFLYIQAASRIPLMISLSTCKTKQKLLAWRPWEQSRLEPGLRERASISLCYTLRAWIGVALLKGNFHLQLQTGGTAFWGLVVSSRVLGLTWRLRFSFPTLLLTQGLARLCYGLRCVHPTIHLFRYLRV